MSKEQHTPGPWILSPDKFAGRQRWFVLGDEKAEEALALVYGKEADAHLILAAPELLAALRQLETAASLVALRDNSESNPEANRLRDTLANARSAIAKATLP